MDVLERWVNLVTPESASRFLGQAENAHIPGSLGGDGSEGVGLDQLLGVMDELGVATGVLTPALGSGTRHALDVAAAHPDRFLVAGDAWLRYRAGEADPNRFGLSVVKEFGAWWIAGNLMRDIAALRNIELLPWDVWGDMPGPEAPVTDAQHALFDDLAPLTQRPDATFAELEKRYDADDRIRVPPKVLNALRGQAEAI